jgi:hypothetical protein
VLPLLLLNVAPLRPLPPGAVKARTPGIDTAYGHMPLAFEPNDSRTDERVDSLARGRGYSLFLTKGGGATLTMVDAPAAVVRMHVEGGNEQLRGSGASQLLGKVNYLTSGERQSHINVPTFARVVYRDVYPGIDLVYYGNQNRLEYDFIVHPGARPDRIALRFEGADVLSVNDSGGRETVAGRYVVGLDRRVIFEIGRYDTSRPLVIDPVLVYSTFLGGTLRHGSSEGTFAIAVDAEGSIFVGGSTGSIDFPRHPVPTTPRATAATCSCCG